MKFRFLLYGLIATCFWSTIGSAQEIIFNQISVSNGLSSNFVNCIGQSKNGYLWVGTINGLQRYDGARFTSVYRNTSKNRLPPLPVHQILTSKNEQLLWVRMGQTIGLFNISDYSFTRVNISASEHVPQGNNFSLVKDSKGHVFLSVFAYGVFVYNERTLQFERRQSVLNYPSDWRPTALQEDNYGRLWVSGMNGMGCFDPKTKQFYTATYHPDDIPLLSETKGITRIGDFHLDHRGRLFVNIFKEKSGSIAMLLQQGRPAKVIINENNNTSSYSNLDFIVTNNGLIWGYGNNVFNVFDEHHEQFVNFYDAKDPLFGIEISNVFQLFTDRDQNLWVATDNGLYLTTILKKGIRNGTMKHFGNVDVNMVKSIQGNKIIFGSAGNKSHVVACDESLNLKPDHQLDELIWKDAPKNDPDYKKIFAISEKANELWIGCDGGKLIKYDRLAKKSTFLNLPIFNGKAIYVIMTDRNQNQWFATKNGVVIKRDHTGKYSEVANYGVAIYNLYCDRRGDLWIGTRGKGLFRMNPISHKVLEIFTAGNSASSISTNRVGSIIQLNDTLLAVSCSANLNLINLRTKKVIEFTAYDGLPYRVIETMQVDRKGYLWLSTVGGICRFDYKNRTFKTYDRKDGLPNSSNMAEILYLSDQLSNGLLLFAGSKNYVIFNADSLNKHSVPKKVSITDFKLFNTYLSVDSMEKAGGISLNHDQNSISISFASLTYRENNKLSYYYSLIGGNENWTKAESSQSATFASLSPGKYTFMIKAKNDDGVFSPEITELKINIIPAFWQTWWFMVIVFCLALLPFYFIYQLRLRRLIAVQLIREKVARDLHDDIGSTLTSINILSEMAGGKVASEPATVEDYLGRISKNSSHMMESMDDIVWSIKPSNDQMTRIAARMREYAAQILEPQQIIYRFTNTENVNHIKLDMDERRNLFLIFKEALNNISKYAKAKEVRIDLQYHHGILNLTIKDDGIGFDQQSKGDGNGLLNMRKRAEMLNGKIEIVSKINQGTELIVKLPLT